MNILEALNQSTKKLQSNTRIITSDGLYSVSDAVFYATLFRLGKEPSDYIDTPLEDRGEVLKQLGDV